MDNKTKINYKIHYGCVCLLAFTEVVDECSNKMCLVWLMLRCCFIAARFQNKMLQSNFVCRVNSGIAMFLANEGTSRDLVLLQWRWWSSSLLACDYLLVYIWHHIVDCQVTFLLFVYGRYTIYAIQNGKKAISFVAVLLCAWILCFFNMYMCVCVCARAREKKEMGNISTIYRSTSYMRMYLAWCQGELGCGVF